MRAFVDQINGSMVTLLIGDNETATLTIPSAWLPFRVQEGDVLNLSFAKNEEASEEAKSRVSGLLDELGDNP